MDRVRLDFGGFGFWMIFADAVGGILIKLGLVIGFQIARARGSITLYRVILQIKKREV